MQNSFDMFISCIFYLTNQAEHCKQTKHSKRTHASGTAPKEEPKKVYIPENKVWVTFDFDHIGCRYQDRKQQTW